MYPQTTGGGQQSPAVQSQSTGWPSGWLIGGLALIAVGGLFWYSFGPDIRRYLKMQNM